NSVVNGANFLSTLSVAPGEIVNVFGLDIGPPELTQLQLSGGRVTTSLADTRVMFDEIPAPLIYVAKDVVSAVVPFGIASRPTTTIRVQHNGQSSNARTVSVVQALPALFTLDASGRGPAAAVNQNFSYNTAQSPAPKGSVVVLYATGLGQTNPAGLDGKPNAAPFPVPTLPVKVRIAGRTSPVHFVGGAPGFVAGAMQLNVQIPDDCPSGAVPVVVQVGETSSTQNVSIWVQ
ncbi:MAG TPA: hypothetical protein VEQ63_08970, partial [Bryobacteraceae bacterium]|nr:hypothetical protein [Bryobacteraceae bacterium]